MTRAVRRAKRDEPRAGQQDAERSEALRGSTREGQARGSFVMRSFVVVALAIGLAGVAAAQGVGSGSAGSDATGSATAGSAGAGSAAGSGSGAGSGSASKRKIIQLPNDINAPKVTAAASPSTVKLGARFTLFVTIEYGPGVEVNLQEPVDVSTAFEVKRKVSKDSVSTTGTRIREYQLEVYAWELGDLRVPGIIVSYTSLGKLAQVETNEVPVRVVGVLGDTDDPKLMRDSAAPVPLIRRDLFWLWIGCVVVGLITFALLVRWLRRRRRRRVVRLVAGALPAPRRIDMTSQRALERLLAIEKSGVLESEDTRKQGYLEMIEVIRDYVGTRYRTPTYDRTSYELVKALAKTAPADELAMVEAWFERCDLVRYGGMRATQRQAADVLADARALVIATTRVVEPPAPPPAPEAREASGAHEPPQPPASGSGTMPSPPSAGAA
jgi:hypothetical protein